MRKKPKISQSEYNLSLFLPAMTFFPVHIHNLFRPSVAVKTGAHVCTQVKCVVWRGGVHWNKLGWNDWTKTALYQF